MQVEHHQHGAGRCRSAPHDARQALRACTISSPEVPRRSGERTRALRDRLRRSRAAGRGGLMNGGAPCCPCGVGIQRRPVMARPARRVMASQACQGAALLPRHSRGSVSRFHGPSCSEPVDLAMSPVTREALYGFLERLFDGIPAARASALSLHVLGSPRRAPPAFLRRIAAFPVPRSFTLVSLRGERVPTRSTKTPQLLEFPSLAPAPGVHWSVLSSKELRLRSVPPARAALVASFRST